MTRLIFRDVDTPYDFMKRDGKPYVAGSEDIIPLVGALTDFAHARHIPIVASADNHDRSHPEISDTPDWRVIEPEPQDPGALRQRVLAIEAISCCTNTHWTSAATPTR
jgi:nicotinamidase-related amidase